MAERLQRLNNQTAFFQLNPVLLQRRVFENQARVTNLVSLVWPFEKQTARAGTWVDNCAYGWMLAIS